MLKNYLRNNISLLEKRLTSNDLVLRKIRLMVPAQRATITPPIGPTLGQFGINIKDFCDKFNERTKNIDSDVLLIVNLVLYKNKTFSFEYKMPSVAFLVNEEDFYLEDLKLVHKFLPLTSFYKIVKFKSRVLMQSDYSVAKAIVGSLFSMHVCLINDIYDVQKRKKKLLIS